MWLRCSQNRNTNLLVDGKGTVNYEIDKSEPKAKKQKYFKAQIGFII